MFPLDFSLESRENVQKSKIFEKPLNKISKNGGAARVHDAAAVRFQCFLFYVIQPDCFN